MRALTLPRYGAPRGLVVADVGAPRCGDDDVVVAVHAAAVNAADWHIVRGAPFPVRFTTGFPRPHITAPGADVAGVVVAVGAHVTRFAPGDAVVGDLSGDGFGAFAEQARGRASRFAKKPPSVSFVDAAATPMAGVTAWRGLRQVGGVRPGERVLVTGAAGGVGSFGVQLARHLGARVTAACRADKQEAVRGLGVDDVLTVDDALAARDAFDVILDCAADRSPFAWRRALRAGGRHVLVGGALLPLLQTNLLGALVGAVSGRRFRGLLSAPDAALLAEVLALVADGTVRPLITQRLDLDDAGTGIALVEERRAIGKVIIDVAG